MKKVVFGFFLLVCFSVQAQGPTGKYEFQFVELTPDSLEIDTLPYAQAPLSFIVVTDTGSYERKDTTNSLGKILTTVPVNLDTFKIIWDGAPCGSKTIKTITNEVDIPIENETVPLKIGVFVPKFITLDIRFETDKVDLRDVPGNTKAMEQIASYLYNNQQIFGECATFEIQGHTDSVGTNEYNLKLSKGRAETVRQYISDKFPEIDMTKVFAVGYGEGKPIADNSTEIGRAQNRRVVVDFSPKTTETKK